MQVPLFDKNFAIVDYSPNYQCWLIESGLDKLLWKGKVEMQEQTEPEIRLRLQAKSRKKVRNGDIFVIDLFEVGFVWGRVANSEAWNGMSKSSPLIVVYIYNVCTPAVDEIPSLELHNLVLPPFIVSRQMWTYGYFNTVANRELTPEDLLEVHCFQTLQVPPRYFDEFDHKLDRRFEPCGNWGLTLPRGINTEVCRMLGVSPTV